MNSFGKPDVANSRVWSDERGSVSIGWDEYSYLISSSLQKVVHRDQFISDIPANVIERLTFGLDFVIILLIVERMIHDRLDKATDWLTDPIQRKQLLPPMRANPLPLGENTCDDRIRQPFRTSSVQPVRSELPPGGVIRALIT